MTIMAKRSPQGEQLSSSPMKEEKALNADGEIDGLHVAAEDMIAAFHEKSPQKLQAALDAYIEMKLLKASEPSEE